MELQFPINDLDQPKKLSLKRLVGILLSEFQPFAVMHNSFIINDVPEDLYVHANKQDLIMVISSLLNSVVSRSRNGCIRITARRYSNIVVFRLKDSCASISQPDYYNWHKLNMLAGKLGGYVLENDKRSKNAALTFRFQSLANAA